MPERPDYGLDAPGVVRRFLLLGVSFLAAAVLLLLFRNRAPLARWFIFPLLSIGISCSFTALIMTWGSRCGKVRFAERLLASIPWHGDEQVLDVGCGHGLMLIGAARHLPRGKATGVDLWQNEDQAANSRQATERNAVLAGVSSRIEIRDGDARKLPFDDETFDVVTSSWVLHNICDAEERRRALVEIIRVLKPGGHLLLADIQYCGDYAKIVSEIGLAEVKLSGRNFLFVIPTRTLIARKPVPVPAGLTAA